MLKIFPTSIALYAYGSSAKLLMQVSIIPGKKLLMTHRTLMWVDCLVWWLRWSWYLLFLWKAFLYPLNGQIISSALSRSIFSLLLLNKLPQTSEIIGWCFLKLCWRSDCLSLEYVWQSLHLTSFAFASCDFR